MFSETNTYWKMVKQYDIENKLKAEKRNIAIQGEIIGEGIQDNKYKLRGQKFLTFNIFDINRHRYLTKYEMELLCQKLNLEMVPTIHVKFNLSEKMSDLILYADGMSKINPLIMREGIVWVANDSNKRISFKTISNKFLNKYEE
jgi:RNA ligase (TIGR02306 family)